MNLTRRVSPQDAVGHHWGTTIAVNPAAVAAGARAAEAATGLRPI